MNMFNHKEWLIKDNIIMEDKKYFDKVFKGKLAKYICIVYFHTFSRNFKIIITQMKLYFKFVGKKGIVIV